MKTLFKIFSLLVVLSTFVYSQTGTRLIDYNTKSLGRGGTSIGNFDNTNLMMTNPAGISFLNSSMLDANFSMMFPTVHFKNNLNDTDGDDNIFPMPSVGYVHKYKESPITWGISFVTNGGMGADFNLNHALYRDNSGNFVKQEYHSQLATMQGGLTIAYQFNEKFSVGASLHLVYSMLEFAMPYSLDPAVMKGTAAPGMTFGDMFAAPSTSGGFGYSEVTATAKMDDLAAFGFNGKIGVAYKVNDKLSFGLSYTMPTTLTYSDGKASMDMTAQLNDAFGKAVAGAMAQGMSQADAQAAIMTQFGNMGIDLTQGVEATYDLEAELKYPQSVGFGVAYAVSKCFRLSADVEYLTWESAFDQMSLKLSNGSSTNVNTMIGSSSINVDFPMDWENSLNLKLGAEYAINDGIVVRAGYAYNQNPVPETTVFPVFPAVVENHIMLGGSFYIMKQLDLHLAFETALNNSVEASNPSKVANEYNGSTSELQTMLFHIGLSYNF